MAGFEPACNTIIRMNLRIVVAVSFISTAQNGRAPPSFYYTPSLDTRHLGWRVR